MTVQKHTVHPPAVNGIHMETVFRNHVQCNQSHSVVLGCRPSPVVGKYMRFVWIRILDAQTIHRSSINAPVALSGHVAVIAVTDVSLEVLIGIIRF